MIVAVDETFVTRKKVNKGGFQGHVTAGHKTTVFGAAELLPQPDGTRKEGPREGSKCISIGNLKDLLVSGSKKDTLARAS